MRKTQWSGMVAAGQTEDAGLLENILFKPVAGCLPVGTLSQTGGSDCVQGTAHLARAGRLPGVRLLLVEDNAVNQQLAKELLEMEGASVLIARNGRIALEVLQETGIAHFDAVLMDLQMPEMDGYEAVQRIRSMPDNSQLPVIAMTAHAMSEERDRCLALGMQDHLAKPVDPELLVAKLAHWIGTEKLDHAARNTVPHLTAMMDAAAVETIPGIDMQAALRRCNGDAALLHDLLRTFRNHYGDAGQRLRALCEAGQLKEAYLLAHTVKGAAANLAMMEVAAAAAAIERVLKNAAHDHSEDTHDSARRV